MLFENPFFIVVIGVLATAFPLMIWWSTGDRRFLYGILFSLLVFAGWLTVERYVETDREAVHRTIYELRDLVRENKIDELLTYVESEAKGAASAELKRFEFVGCGVSQLSNQPEFWTKDGEKFARVNFIGSATASNFDRTLGPVKLQLTLREASPGNWKVVDYGYKLLGDQNQEWRRNVRVY